MSSSYQPTTVSTEGTKHHSLLEMLANQKVLPITHSDPSKQSAIDSTKIGWICKHATHGRQIIWGHIFIQWADLPLFPGLPHVSLVLRPLPSKERPGTHCLRMHKIFPWKALCTLPSDMVASNTPSWSLKWSCDYLYWSHTRHILEVMWLPILITHTSYTGGHVTTYTDHTHVHILEAMWLPILITHMYIYWRPCDYLYWSHTCTYTGGHVTMYTDILILIKLLCTC